MRFPFTCPSPCQKKKYKFSTALAKDLLQLIPAAANGNNSTAVRARGSRGRRGGGELAAVGGVVLARNQKQINEFMLHL